MKNLHIKPIFLVFIEGWQGIEISPQQLFYRYFVAEYNINLACLLNVDEGTVSSCYTLSDIPEYLTDLFKVLKLTRMKIWFDWNISKWNAEFSSNKSSFAIKQRKLGPGSCNETVFVIVRSRSPRRL